MGMTTETTERQPGTAMVFPGMGPVKFADVGEFLTFNSHARKRLKVADEVLGYSLMDRYRRSADDYDEAAQVAFLTVSSALADWAEESLEVRPVICAGPSFGQRAMAAYSGALSFADTVRLTVRLARCEAEYFATEYEDVVTLTFLRTPRERLDEILAELTERGEYFDFSGYLDRDFYMLSLREPMLDWMRGRISAAGGYSLYTMRPPVHAAAFGKLRRRVEEEVFGEFDFAAPRLPVVADQDGSLVTTAAGLRTMLLDTFDRPVHWERVTRTLREQGVRRICMAGPENIFARLDCTTADFELLSATPERTLRQQA
ncbi:hypothetical protein GCM10017771_70380 [Streptomyces capitiformicae]|uniref:[acyl-carrier-protein] S-malonyltransferase n=2 Tax=Streptomyces capitiformicae TaxID=2014920 RepID=A0A918ZF19_9ACTN|nr:hypothetical protein GCM10017771_70380 [Streptomyces capitiformicae]